MSLNPQIESHEERLQRVEENSEDTRVKVVEISVKLDHQQELAELTRSDLAGRIDNGFARLADNHQKVLVQLDEHGRKLATHQLTLSKIEEAKKASKRRTDLVKKIVVAALLAAAGVVGTELVKNLLGV